MKKILFIFTIAALGCQTLHAQQIKGFVYGAGEPLPGATVYWTDDNSGGAATSGTVTAADGSFTLGKTAGMDMLVATFIGYVPDTIRVDGTEVMFDLAEDSNILDIVEVTTTRRGNYIETTGITKNELISYSGLIKMACCNLAESFENSAAVTVGYSDAVSGARQIKMLGLTGVYSQLLDESRPVMRGLATPYGLNYTPGMWLQSIQVSKGTSSVAHGHEAISGQINLEYRKPTDEEPLFINGYFDEQLRAELNVASSLQVNDRLSTVILAHGSTDLREEDHDNDGFLDMPLARQVNVANRWLYTAPSGVQLRAGLRFLAEDRDGGQKGFKSSLHRGGTEVYGSQIDNRNFNAYVKAAFPVGKVIYDPATSEVVRSNIAVVADFNHFSQKAFFGIKDFDGIQNSVYANLIYNLNISLKHTLVMGASATLDNYHERFTDRYLLGDPAGSHTVAESFNDLGRAEREGGAFAEYNLSLGSRFNLIGGLRADYHNLYDWIVTPRAHLRWELTPGLVLRASAGTGSRSANLITDNIGMLATGRRILIPEGLDRLEKSTTLGGSLTYTFRLGADDGASLSFDYFRTRFSNQIVADQEYDRGLVYLYNLPGHPTTDTWQGDFNWRPFTGFEFFATFRYTDTNIKLNRPDGTSVEVRKPLMDKFKTLVNLQYATRFRKWVFDFTAQLNGQSRLPSLEATPAVSEYSPVYPMFFAQVSRKFRRIDIYVGCENIGDYRQKHPVISADSPFDTSFNSSVVWGPLMGRKVYGGFRFSL